MRRSGQCPHDVCRHRFSGKGGIAAQIGGPELRGGQSALEMTLLAMTIRTRIK